MNKRFAALIVLPLALVALLVSVKWKQLHPTPTQLDLQERAYLRQAKTLNVVNLSSPKDNYFSLPANEFKATLNDFYLMEFLKVRTSYSMRTAPVSVYKVVVRADKSSTEPLATIILDQLPRYESPQTYSSVHFVTERRLRELVTKYDSAQ